MIKLNNEIAKEIANDVDLREKEKLNKNACFSKDAIYENPHKTNAVIGNFSDDVDKIINTKAYTRYMGKTQVFSMVQNDLITTRGLHVQLVSKIARNIGRSLGYNEDLIEAISLGHDLGHTPFGHDGERAINNITKNFGYYFKHNAQSVRILRDILNANVSLQVLDGIACHNGESVKFADDKNPGEGYKPNFNKKSANVIMEYQNCFKDVNADKTMVPMTYEGCIMRISDLISYVGRDFEDAISLGLLKRSDLPKDIKDVLGSENRQIVRSLTYDIINNSYGKEGLFFSKECHEAFEALFDFNYKNIYYNPVTQDSKDKRDNMFGIMYEKYLNDIKDGNENSSIYNFINSNSKEYRELTRPEIMVVDFIAGMTDEFFIREYEDYVMPRSRGLKLF
ncbi:MAG: HD domain-containing protein [Clostridia bacterium]|nr:HD domain-containing protein [Clostridia bacterium]